MIHHFRYIIYPIATLVLGVISWLIYRFRASRNAVAPPILVHKLSPQERDSIIAHIESDQPKLANRNLTDWERVNLLRQWACEHIKWGSDSVQYHTFFVKNIFEFLDIFERNEGAVKCEGAAYFLMRLYKLYGYTASILDVSIDHLLTHALVVVGINYKGQNIAVMQGSYYNTTFTNHVGVPYDYRGMITLLKQQRDDLVKVNEHHRDYYFLAKPEDNISEFHGLTVNPDNKTILPNGLLKYPAHETFGAFDQIVRNNSIGQAFQKMGYPPNLVYLFTCNPKIRNDYAEET